MTSTKTPPTSADAKRVERALLARLGLPASASAQDVEAAHDELATFLETAPDDLSGWAGMQIAAIDEAYALLSDPTIDRGAVLLDVSLATASNGASSARPAATAAPAAAIPATSRNPLIRRVAIGAVVIVGAVAIAVAGFNLNGGTGVPPMTGSPAPEAQASAAVDQAQVAALMQKIQANPKDVAALQSLADIYYQASDFASAADFLDRIIAVDPKNLTALLALGATQYNQGDATSAEKQWRAVLAIDDQNIDAHYYLGFMYLTQTPSDTVNAKAEWAQVIAIDPNSDIAKNVAQHLASLDASPAPGGSAAPGPSGTPAPSQAPAASSAPAASPADASPAPSATSAN